MGVMRMMWVVVLLAAVGGMAGLARGQGAGGGGIRVVVVDAEDGKGVGEFQVLAGVPFSRPQVGAAGAVEVVSWQPHTIKSGRDGALFWQVGRGYPEMALRVEAAGYVPQRQTRLMRGQELATMEFKMVKDAGILARVMAPDGKPAAGAKVALALPQRGVSIKGGKIERVELGREEMAADRWQRPVVAEADGEGRVRVMTETDPACVMVVVHETGVRAMAFAEFMAAPEVKLEAWGKVEGRVSWLGKAGAGERLTMGASRDDLYPGLIEQYLEARSDEEGRFVFEKVMPGKVQISRPTKVDGDGARADGVSEVIVEGMYAHVTVAAGKPTAVLFGGQGRKVTARLTGLASWEGVTVRFAPAAPHFGFPGDDASWKAVGLMQSSAIGPMYYREVKPDGEGKLEMDGVLPGRYQLIVTGRGDAAGSTTVVVPLEKPGEAPATVEVVAVAVQTGSR